jgi:hypothetical protein
LSFASEAHGLAVFNGVVALQKLAEGFKSIVSFFLPVNFPDKKGIERPEKLELDYLKF